VLAHICARSVASYPYPSLSFLSFLFFLFDNACISISMLLITVGGTKHLIRSVPVQAHPTAASTPCPLPAPAPAPASSSHSSSESDFASASADEVVAVTSTEMMEVEKETETVLEDCVRQSENDHLYNSTREHLAMSCGVCGTMVSLIPPLLPVPSIFTALH
jgi:hypothetical protein